MKMKIKNIHIIVLLLSIVFISCCISLNSNLGIEYNNYITNENFREGLTNPENTTNPINTSSGKLPKLNYEPIGIKKEQLPKGQEDLYILKSQIVPPVCPACPTVSACPTQDPPPPCPPCGRCPEPSFDCKKVPNYSSANISRYAPRPVLSDFSQFGM